MHNSEVMRHDKHIATKRSWSAKWLTAPGADFRNHLKFKAEFRPAPYFRRAFYCSKAQVANAKLYICGLGYFAACINGKRVGNGVLDPVCSVYDKRAYYLVFDISELLKHDAINVIAVTLGNGLYYCDSGEVWHYFKASWRNYPRFIAEIVDKQQGLIVGSDREWRFSEGPIRFDCVRNGETYDAGKELPDAWYKDGDLNESGYLNAAITMPPGGVLEEQYMPQTVVARTVESVKLHDLDADRAIYDIGENISGKARISVAGEAGTEIILEYGERLDYSGDIDRADTISLIDGEVQVDRYFLKGGQTEIWEPEFVYHGFRYVRTIINGYAKINKLEGRIIHTDFTAVGQIETSDPVVNKLQQATVRSYLSNYVGIPTDCPHREKNGWTGDAQLALDVGFYNFDVAAAYAQWMESITDNQRPSGQIPGISPSGGWAYNWGSGPVYDIALLLIPYCVWLYRGDTSLIEQYYDAMKRYLDYCDCIADDCLIKFGLGDWSPYNQDTLVSSTFTSSAYYYYAANLMQKFAGILGNRADGDIYGKLAGEIKKAINDKFARSDGSYVENQLTALSCALYFNLPQDNAVKAKTLALLTSKLEQNNAIADVGILGSRYVPRVLADNDYANLAFKFITQPEYPGWGYWMQQGATTLWEQWNGASSRNHIMRGDISAWFYKYIGGIIPDEQYPGFERFTIAPKIIDGLKCAKVEYLSPYGKIVSHWQQDNGTVEYKILVPKKTEARFVLPDKSVITFAAGAYQFRK